MAAVAVMTAALTTVPASTFVDFTALSAEDPLSAGGVWSNNTQGVGTNTAPTTGTSMRIATRTGGGGVICMGSTTAQANYEDSFAFIPAVWNKTSNMRVTATIFRAAGYNPSDNHELEILFGCKTGANYHRWIECLWSAAGAQDVANQDGDFVGTAYTIIGVSTGLLSGGPADGDKMVAEIYPATNRVRWGRIRAGTTIWAQDVTNALIDSTLGDGMGVGAFRRSTLPDSVAASLGFTDILIEAF